ncbi:MAG: CocE/NonD family hydrolase [Actinomycetota bacterium]
MAATDDVFLPMRDGVRIAATVYRPDGVGPWPCLVEALPYRKDDLTAHYRPEYHRFADEFGYVVCRIDVRGTGSSEGIATGEYTADELEDIAEAIAWLAAQPWSNGNVGMYGTSWSGFNSLQVAMLRPPALKAICSIFASDDRYADDVHYFGGMLKQLDLVDYPLYMEAMNVLPPVPRIVGQGWRDAWERRVASYTPWLLDQLEHQTYDAFWKHGSLREDFGAITAPTMLVTGWADGYTNIALRGMAELECPRRLLAGPWSHADVETSRPGPNIDLVVEMARWWDRWLKGVDNGVDREPPIVVFVRRPTPPAWDLPIYRGEWRFEAGWPIERGGERALSLETARSNRSGEGPDALDVRGDVGWTAWISCAGKPPWGQPLDQRPDEAFSLVYDWEPLQDEVEILGHPTVRARLASSAPVACLSAKLCDVHPDGTSQLVTRGLLNLTHRDARESPSPLEPGQSYDVTLELEVTSWVFEPGHRIRLDLAGTDWPNCWPPPTPVTLTIDRTRSSLVLPIVEGPAPVAERPALPEPRLPQIWSADGVRSTIEHDLARRETRAIVRYGGSSEADEVAPLIDERYAGTVGVSTDDPGRAWVDATATYTISWPEATVTAEARGRIESDAKAFHVRLEIDTTEDGQRTWSRRFDRRIPRRLL